MGTEGSVGIGKVKEYSGRPILILDSKFGKHGILHAV